MAVVFDVTQMKGIYTFAFYGRSHCMMCTSLILKCSLKSGANLPTISLAKQLLCKQPSVAPLK